MIPVTPAPEPPDFDHRVRRRGLDAIAELVGEKPSRPRPGPARTQVANRREDIRSEDFPPYWRDALGDMLASYNRLCAYLALHIERATGNASVDHVVPKSKAWDRVYEWDNYRLACALVNSRKNDTDLALDPFTIHHGMFALEFVELQVKPGPSAGALLPRVLDTIDVLGLNMQECRRARECYVESYRAREITLPYLERRAPFVASELRRQGLLLEGDI